MLRRRRHNCSTSTNLDSIVRKKEKEFQDIQNRLSCIIQKVEHCQEIIDGLCEDDCNLLNW